MSAGLFLAGMSAVIGGMLVAAQGPIYARLSEDPNRDPLAAVFVAFLTATLSTGLLVVGFGSWRSISLPGWPRFLPGFSLAVCLEPAMS